VRAGRTDVVVVTVTVTTVTVCWRVTVCWGPGGKKQPQALEMPSTTGRQSLHFPPRSSWPRGTTAGVGPGALIVTSMLPASCGTMRAPALRSGQVVDVGRGLVYRYTVYPKSVAVLEEGGGNHQDCLRGDLGESDKRK
jgi:hypothetical protein